MWVVVTIFLKFIIMLRFPSDVSISTIEKLVCEKKENVERMSSKVSRVSQFLNYAKYTLYIASMKHCTQVL